MDLNVLLTGGAVTFQSNLKQRYNLAKSKESAFAASVFSILSSFLHS